MPPRSSGLLTKNGVLATVRTAVTVFDAEYRTFQKASDHFRLSAEKCLDVVSRALSKPGWARDSDTQIPSFSRATKDHKPLSKREAQILKLIAEGYGTKQAAEALGIAFKTAVGHRSKLMQKLGIHDASGLTRYAIRTGHIVP